MTSPGSQHPPPNPSDPSRPSLSGPVTDPSDVFGGGSSDASGEASSEPGGAPSAKSSASSGWIDFHMVRKRVRAFTVLVAVLLLWGLYDVWVGPRSAFEFGSLQAEAHEVRAEVARLERETSRMLYNLRAMEEDPVALERLLAEERKVATGDGKVYTFPEDTDP